MPLIGSFVMPHPPLAVPEVGKGEEAAIPQTLRAYERAGRLARDLAPDTVVLVSPHAMTYYDAFRVCGAERWRADLEVFRAPEAVVDMPCDTELGKAVTQAGLDAGFMTVMEDAGPGETQDHGSFVPLYFLQKYLPDRVKLLRLSFSGLSHEDHVAYGRALGRVFDAWPERVLFVASGDLSHRLRTTGPYGLSRKAPAFEEDLLARLALGALDRVPALDADLCDEVGECGVRSICIMAGVMEGRDYVPRLWSHEDVFGVGYAIATYLPRASAGEEVTLARLSLETRVRLDATLRTDCMPWTRKLRERQAGAFVSLHQTPEEGEEEGELRGCIGTIRASRPNLEEEIIAMAIEAGTEDPRFDPVTPEELPGLVYNVDVLGEAEPISGPEELDVKRYGVIVSNGWRRGLLLPDLPGVTTVSRQIAIAREKAGIYPGEPFSLERFEVTRYPDETRADASMAFPPAEERTEADD